MSQIQIGVICYRAPDGSALSTQPIYRDIPDGSEGDKIRAKISRTQDQLLYDFSKGIWKRMVELCKSKRKEGVEVHDK